MIHLFCGYDAREAIGFHVFVASVLERTHAQVALHVLDAKGGRAGTNAFTFSRFLVPHLMDFSGRAIFADACDMLMVDDIADLAALFDPRKAVQCVQHDYRTRNPHKYVGTSMECVNADYARKNWASLMLINCEHPAWRGIGPEAVEAARPLDMLQLRFIAERHIGALPGRWNRLVDEGQSVDGAGLLHWTAGIPAFEHYVNAPGAEQWHAQRARMQEVA